METPMTHTAIEVRELAAKYADFEFGNKVMDADDFIDLEADIRRLAAALDRSPTVGPDLQQRLVSALYGPGVRRSDTVEELVDALIAITALDRSPTVVGEEGVQSNNPEIPDGWVLVPRKPTGAMKKAVSDAAGAQALAWGLAAWQEMIAAAPASPSKPEQAPSPVPQVVAWREVLDDILDEDAPNKWVWKTFDSMDEWLRTKILPLLRTIRAASPLSGGDTGKVEVTDEMVEVALNATVPGGADVKDWFHHHTPKGYRTAQEVIRTALTAALRTLAGGK